MGSRTNPWGTPDETFKQKRPIEGLLDPCFISFLFSF